MGESVGVAQLDLELNEAGFKRDVNSFSKRAGNLIGGAFKAIGVAFAAKKLFDFGKEGVQLASDLQEVQNVVDVTFRDMAGDVNEFSKNALNSFGLSELSAKRFTSTMGAMLKSSGITGPQMAEMSETITGLAADMASFYNLDHETAFNKIRSGISGETEPLRQLGINMSVANMEAYALEKGMTKAWMKMSQQEQTLLRYNYLLDKTTDAQGDFVRTQDSWANQTRLLSEQWKILQGTLGAGFMNVLTPTVKMLNTLVSRLQIAAQYFKSFTELLFGQTKAAGSAASNVLNMNDATEGAGASVKKANKDIKGSLMGFDELNTLADSTASNMEDIAELTPDVATDIGLGDTEPVTPEIDTSKMQPIIDFLNNIKVALDGVGQFITDKFGEPLNAALNSVLPVLINWKDSLVNTIKDVLLLWEPFKNWFGNVLIPAWQQIIPIAGSILGGLLDSALLVFDGIKNAIMPVLEWLISDGLTILTEFGLGCWQVFQSIFDAAKFIFDTLWEGAVSPGLNLVSTMVIDVLNIIKGFWNTHCVNIISNLKTYFENIKVLFQSLWKNFLEPIVSNMLKMLSWLWDKHLKGVVEEVVNFVGKLVNGALEIYNKFIMPLVKWFIETFGPGIANAINYVVDIFGTLIAVIADIVKGIIKIVGGIIDFIVGVFTGDWEKAWEGVKDIFKGIWDIIVSVLKGAINILIDAINFAIRGLNNISVDIPDWVADLLGLAKGTSFGINIPMIPKLATGGIIDSPTLAMLGENHKKEAVIPLENTGFIDAIASAVGNALMQALQFFTTTNSSTGNQEIVLQIDGVAFARFIIPAMRDEGTRIGIPVLQEV